MEYRLVSFVKPDEAAADGAGAQAEGNERRRQQQQLQQQLQQKGGGGSGGSPLQTVSPNPC